MRVSFAAALVWTGCQSKSANYLPPTSSAGSISDLSHKSGTATKKRPAAPQILMLVSHDAAGKAVHAEVRQSSGDPALDNRAVQMVLHRMTFPRGQANTLIVPIDPKSVPKK
jgi:hypothetical protein